MERLIDQGILYVAGLLLLAETKGWVRPVLAALLVLIYVAVSNYVESGRVRLVLSAILTVGCCFLPGLLCFLPLVCYDCVWLFLEHMSFFISVRRASCCLRYLHWFMEKTVWSRNWNGLYFCLYLPEAEHTACGGTCTRKKPIFI